MKQGESIRFALALREHGVEERLLRVLSAFEPLSAVEIAEITGQKRVTEHCAVSRLREGKTIHVGSYGQRAGRGGPSTPKFCIGRHDDVRPPAKKTHKELSLESRERLKRERPQVNAERNQKAWRDQKARLEADPERRKALRQYKNEWDRERYGYVPRVLRNKQQLAEIAIQFGITRDVTKSNRSARKAA
jgi:hypothetical protein